MTSSAKSNNGTFNIKRTRSRREFINQSMGGIALAGILGTGISARLKPADDTQAQESRKLKIVVAGGHPGDPEYGCGGTIARYTALGNEVVLLYLNRGEGGIPTKTGPEAGEIRSAEAVIACGILNARAVFATQTDGMSIVDGLHYDEFYEILKDEQPDVIFTQWPIDNHRDHRAISTLIYDAWLKLTSPGSSKKAELYYYEVSNGEDTQMFTPVNYVDITGQESLKRKACYAHASQSPDMFYSLQEQVSRFRGLECGYKHAEAFIPHARSKAALLPPSL